VRSPKSRAIIRRIAEKEGLTIKQVEEIVYSFFHFTSKRMKESDKMTYDYKATRLFKFGTFRVKQGRINHKKRLREKSIRNNQRTSDNLSGSIDDQGVQKGLESGQIEQEG
jgi:nucleoid DNA-binding protein